MHSVQPQCGDQQRYSYPIKYLEECKETIATLLEEGQQFGEVVRLAFVGDDQEVQIDEEGLYLLQKYSNHQIAFLGLMGCNQTNNSFVLDTILNLSGHHGNHFSDIYAQKQQKTVLLWSIPFSAHPKLKIFLLSCSGMEESQEAFDRSQQILLDLSLLLCSSLGLVNIPDLAIQKNRRIFSEEVASYGKKQDWLGFFIEELSRSSKRIINTHFQDKRKDPLWPTELTTFQPYKYHSSSQQNLNSIIKESSLVETDTPLIQKDQSIEQLFISLNEPQPRFNPPFVKQVSNFLIEAVRSIVSKQYEEVRFTGNILCKLLINSVKYMNKKSGLKINKVFNSLFKELYEASFIYHTDNYQELLQQQFESEEPKQYDQLLQIFERVQDIVVHSFNQNIISESNHEQYQQQLLNFIEEKQQMLIEVNYKKTKRIISEQINQLHQRTSFQPELIKQYLFSLKELVKRHNHHPIRLITHKLDKYSNNLEKRIIDQKLKEEKQKISAIKKTIRTTYQIYKAEKEENEQTRKENQQNEKAHKRLLRQAYQLQNRVKVIKKEIETEKKFHKEFMVSKENNKELAEAHLQTIRELEEIARQNQKQTDQIHKQFDYHPEILALNKQIEDREREIKALEKNQSRLASQLYQQSGIRAAKQKSPEAAPERRTIKRLTKSKK